MPILFDLTQNVKNYNVTPLLLFPAFLWKAIQEISTGLFKSEILYSSHIKFFSYRCVVFEYVKQVKWICYKY